MNKINSEHIKIVHTYLYGSVRNVLLGAGLCYATENKFYNHIPLIFIFPSIYSGYHIYKNKDKIRNYIEYK